MDGLPSLQTISLEGQSGIGSQAAVSVYRSVYGHVLAKVLSSGGR